MALHTVQCPTPFNLDTTLRCGQLFRWEKFDGWWCGVTEQRVLKVRQRENTLVFTGSDVDFVTRYFRLDDEISRILCKISRDSLVERAVQTFPGLHLVRQDPWECLISYMCATLKNIPAIKDMVFRLSMHFGEEIDRKKGLFGFPEPERLAKASLTKLGKCKLGFRAQRIRNVARKVANGEVDFESLKKKGYAKAKQELVQLPGVGDKVADCVLLFSLEKLQAFPVDVWIKRVIQEHYKGHFDQRFIERLQEEHSLTPKDYDKISLFGQKYFGEFAGYAQQYLFHYARCKMLL